MAGKIIHVHEGGSMRKVLLITAIGCVTGSAALWAQSPERTPPPKVDKASAYYHYTLAHMYAEQASMFGNRGDFVNKAIENYKEAIKADPTAAMLSEELSDLYVQSGRLREAQTDAEDVLKQNPNDLNAHRLLARIFTRLVGDGRSGKVDENMLRRATDQYQKITQLAPKDVPAWLMLARLQKAADNSVDAQKSYQKVLDIEPDNEDALTGLALVYSDLGDNRKAAELLKLLADKNPTPRSLTALAAAYEQMRDFKGAAGVLRKLLETNPANEREVQRNLAQDLMLSQDYAAALEVYNQLVMDDPADSQSYLRISQIYRQERDFAKAREANDKAKAVEPNSIEIRYNEVNILEAEDRTGEATQLLKEILDSTTKRNYNQAERGNRTALLERLAGLYRSMDQTDRAIDAYRQIADVDPTLAQRSSAQVIDTYRTGKEYAKAQQEADAAIKKWPDDRMIRMTRDSMLAEMGKIDEAAADLKKLLSGKDDRDIYVSLANTYEKGKRWDDMGKALDAAEKISDSTEDKSGIWFMRGAMLERMKKLDKAEVEFRKVLKADPDNAGAMNYIGYMLADANLRLEESLDLITKALDIEPGNGAYLDSLGWVQYRLGRLEDAEKNLRRALDKTPRDPTVHDHMADILMKESKVKEAVAQWESSLKEWDTSSPTDLDPTEIAQVKRKLEAARVRLAREVPRQ
jgi:tetratricopeptide (TPR) repeat protein